MSVKIDLQQLLDIALATPEVGNVNFNILRGFLHEVLKHLGIRKKVIYISDDGDFKTACDFIRDGIILARSRTPSELDFIDEHTEADSGSAKLRSTSYVKAQDEASDVISRRIRSASPRLSQRSVTVSSGGIPIITGDVEQTESSGGVSKAPGESEKSRLTSPKTYRSTIRSPNLSKALLDPTGLSSIETRRSVEVLLGRGETLKSLMKKVSELKARVDIMETTEAAVVPSAASLIRRDSKTPAHDMMQIISVNRKLEASENSIGGLTELVDVLSTELNDIKDVIPNITGIPDILSDIEKLKISVHKVQKQISDNAATEKVGILEDSIKSLKKQVKDAMKKPSIDLTQIEKLVDKTIAHEMNKVAQAVAQSSDGTSAPIIVSSEPPRELIDALEKIESLVESQRYLEEQIQEMKEIGEESMPPTPIGDGPADSRPAPIPHEIEHDLKILKKKFDSCSKEAGVAHSTVCRLDKENKKQSSLIEENKLEIHQLKNSLMLLQREAAETAATSQVVREEDATPPTPSRSRARSMDAEDLSLIRSMIFDLQEEKDKLKHANKCLLEELNQKQKSLDDLYEQLQRLYDVKADKDLLSSEVYVKADKTEVALKVGREDFEHYIGLVDQSLRDLLQRLEGHEDFLKNAIDSLSSNVQTKLDKTEVEPLKHYLETRMKALKPKPIEAPPLDDYAAGFRKVLLKSFHCISCDRPVEYARDGIFPPLPGSQPMPGRKSNRPYTTFELEQIRHHMLRGGLGIEQERFEIMDKQRQRLQNELMRLSGVPNIQELAEVIDRPCGGSHTLSFPHSRNVFRGLHLNKEDVSIETVSKIKNYQAVDIMGQDGHIYKGLVGDVPALPHLPHKPQSPRKCVPRLRQDCSQSGRSLHRSTTPASAHCGDEVIEDAESS